MKQILDAASPRFLTAIVRVRGLLLSLVRRIRRRPLEHANQCERASEVRDPTIRLVVMRIDF